ncbi:TolC family protein [Flavobacterium ajazii]|uniref:TolC family protein n=1 Tax=Flavobacterium ajazii TaxID=2692318 RepID=UPI0013D5A9FA|nr:TolC family protein [Flavobacterium ajazii]
MKLKHQLVGILTLFAVINGTYAQNTLTLEKCIEKALDQSLQLKSDNYDLEKTKASIGQAYSTLLPSINGSASYQYYFDVATSILPSESFGGQAGSYSAVQFGVPQTKSAGITLNQTVFNASSLIALKAAKAYLKLNHLQIQSSKEELIYNITATYYNIQTIDKQIDLSNNNLNNTEKLLKSTQDQYKAGLATQTDVDRLLVTRDNSAASVESSRNSREKYYNLLKLLMNVSLNDSIQVVPFTDIELDAIALQQASFNAENKTNYLQIVENKTITNLQRKNISYGYLPTLSMTGNLSYSGYYTSSNPLKNLNDKWYPSSYIGLNLSVPVFDGFSKKFQIKQKDFELKKLDIQAEQTILQNKKDVADATADLNSNFITYENQKRNFVLAQKVMKDIESQYQNGLVKVSDYINSNTELQSAQNNYITAIINIKQAQLNLKKAQGELIN